MPSRCQGRQEELSAGAVAALIPIPTLPRRLSPFSHLQLHPQTGQEGEKLWGCCLKELLWGSEVREREKLQHL